MAKQVKVVGGRGKKTCGKCGAVCGVRQSVCPECQTPFVKKDVPAPKSKPHTGDLRTALESELASITETLASKSKLEKRAELIKKVLETM